MALGKTTRGKPVRERVIFLSREFYHLQQYTENIKPTYLNPEDKFLSRFVCRATKIELRFFSCFLPRFSCHRRIVWASKFVSPQKILKNHAQKPISKTVPYKLYGPAINAVVFTLIYVPSLLLSFPSICVLQNFFSCSRKMETFSLLSLLTSICKSEAKCLSHAFLRKP